MIDTRLSKVQTTIDRTHTLVDRLKMAQSLDFGVVVMMLSCISKIVAATPPSSPDFSFTIQMPSNPPPLIAPTQLRPSTRTIITTYRRQ